MAANLSNMNNGKRVQPSAHLDASAPKGLKGATDESHAREIIRSPKFFARLQSLLKEDMSAELAGKSARALLSSCKSRISFVDLPAEARNMIYENLVQNEISPGNLFSGIRVSDCLVGSYGEPPALARTCRLVQSELLPMFYGRNAFNLRVFRKGDRLHNLNWLESIGSENIEHLRFIVLHTRNAYINVSFIKDASVIAIDLKGRARIKAEGWEPFKNDPAWRFMEGTSHAVLVRSHCPSPDLDMAQQIHDYLQKTLTGRDPAYLTDQEFRRVLAPAHALKLKVPEPALRAFEIAWAKQDSRNSG